MRFYCILQRNSIGHLLRTSRDNFRPSPKKSFRKEMDNIYVYYRRAFVEFVVLLTKSWLANYDFSVTAKCWREGGSKACFAPPPSFTQRSDRCNFIATYINDAQ